LKNSAIGGDAENASPEGAEYTSTGHRPVKLKQQQRFKQKLPKTP
jgi:hypothetical protein